MVQPCSSRPHILLMGSPGSGKGSLAEFLRLNANYAHLSPGTLYSQEIDDNSKNRLLDPDDRAVVRDHYLAGKPVPIEIFKKMFTVHVDRALADRKFIIFDGPIQSQAFVELFDRLFEEKGLKDRVSFVYLEVDQKTALQRMLGRKICKACDLTYQQEAVCKKCAGFLTRRDDLNPVAITAKIERFQKEGAALAEGYARRPGFISINANLALAELHELYRRLFLHSS